MVYRWAPSSHDVVLQRHVLRHERWSKIVEGFLGDLRPDGMMTPRRRKETIGVGWDNQRRVRCRNWRACSANDDDKTVGRA